MTESHTAPIDSEDLLTTLYKTRQAAYYEITFDFLYSVEYILCICYNRVAHT